MKNQGSLLCSKHGMQALFICSVDKCKENRVICEICKQKETLHFSHHANYIYRFNQFKDFNHSKNTLMRLEKGVNDSESYIAAHRKYYADQILAIKEDIAAMKQEFCNIADKYQKIYVEGFQKQIERFDEQIQNIKTMYKEYVKEKTNEDSFFAKLLYHQKPKTQEQAIENLVTKNSKAFRVRADIINLRSSIAMAKNNKTKYKGTDNDQRKYEQILIYLGDFSNSLFDKFKEILNTNSNDSDSLKSSIVSQSKSLAMSRVSMGSPLDLTNDLRRSNVGSQKNIQQRVPMPDPHPIVLAVKEKLKPLNPPSKNLNMEGPYLYSTGVYYGQFQNNRRNGWGQYVFTDGSMYEGMWENDKMSGYGRLIRKNCYYQGDVNNGRAHGRGNYEDQFRTYAGEWKDDRRSGMGEEEFKTKKKKYVGHFFEDKYHGKGKLIDEEYVYEGKFKEGMFHGDGKINYNNRETFEGSFFQGYRHLGKHKYPDGSYYDGMFKKNVPQGTGNFFWADGVRYEGQWKNGVQDGIGVQIFDNGKQMKGFWRNGQWEKWI